MVKFNLLISHLNGETETNTIEMAIGKRIDNNNLESFVNSAMRADESIKSIKCPAIKNGIELYRNYESKTVLNFKEGQPDLRDDGVYDVVVTTEPYVPSGGRRTSRRKSRRNRKSRKSRR